MKKRIFFIALFMLFLVLAACGTVNNNNHENDQVNDQGNESNDQQANEGDQNADADEAVTETGVYNGQADPHTIEIETDDGPTAFQLSDDARDDVEGLNPGDAVKYTYYKDGEQLIIESIDKEASSGDEDDRLTEMGTYVGQADPHTIEIETDNGSLAFQLTMEAREDVEELEPGDKVTYTYTEDGNHREIESIYKVD